jgi:ribosomal protein S18 acetylase RimI-like enzyme
MSLVQRISRGSVDWTQMAAVIHARPSDHLHVVDLPYRLCSWAFDEPANCAIWENDNGQMLAWAVLQSPFWSIDYAMHPTAPPDTIQAILAWADGRAQAIQHTPFARPMWFINGFAGHHHQQVLEANGFNSQSDVGEDSWTKVLFRRDAHLPPAYPPLPAGFRIRPLDGRAEVEAYVALHRAVFQSESMTSEWRQRTLAHPEYLPNLDLVLTDPESRLAGFCIGWFTADGPNQQPCGQIEPIGVREDLRGQGLGRALLSECLAQLAAAGATSVLVETDNYRDAAFKLYTAIGFRIVRDVVVYRKDYPSA